MKGLFALCLSLLIATSGHAAQGWTWNLGYHNPPGSTLGLNFMYFWTNWAIELGIGQVHSSSSDTNNSDTDTVSVGGDLNLKYLFGSRVVRPYLMGGVGLGTSASSGSNSGVSAGTGSGFLGAGILLSGNPFYFYIGGVMIGRSTDLQAGLGFDF